MKRKTKIICWAGISGWYTSLVTLQEHRLVVFCSIMTYHIICTLWYTLASHVGETQGAVDILHSCLLPAMLMAHQRLHSTLQLPRKTNWRKLGKREGAFCTLQINAESCHAPRDQAKKAPQSAQRETGLLQISQNTLPPPIPVSRLTTLKSRWCISNTIQSDWEYSI